MYGNDQPKFPEIDLATLHEDRSSGSTMCWGTELEISVTEIQYLK